MLDRRLRCLMAYVRARLRRALGQSDDDEIARLVCARQASAYVSTARLDVTLSLAELPIFIRLVGLDRDPGWIPAAGRSAVFGLRVSVCRNRNLPTSRPDLWRTSSSTATPPSCRSSPDWRMCGTLDAAVAQFPFLADYCAELAARGLADLKREASALGCAAGSAQLGGRHRRPSAVAGTARDST